MPRFGDTSQKTNSQKKYFFIDGNIWTSSKNHFSGGGDKQEKKVLSIQHLKVKVSRGV